MKLERFITCSQSLTSDPILSNYNAFNDFVNYPSEIVLILPFFAKYTCVHHATTSRTTAMIAGCPI